MNITQKFKNALLAQAVCDAVGDPFEFKRAWEFTPEQILNYARNEKLYITDDTQMALFLTEGVIANLNGLEAHQAYSSAFVDWYYTQEPKRAPNEYMQGLLTFPEMYNIQSPGRTCLNACNDLLYNETVVNDSKGCGSVMRLLPMVLYRDLNLMVKNGITSALVTHKHQENIEAATLLLATYYGAIHTGEIAVDHGFIHCDSIADIGEGWTAMEAVQMAIWAVANSRNFDELLVKSIHHSGDSDSVAAIAGSIWGLCGNSVRYTERLTELNAINYVIGLTNFI